MGSRTVTVRQGESRKEGGFLGRKERGKTRKKQKERIGEGTDGEATSRTGHSYRSPLRPPFPFYLLPMFLQPTVIPVCSKFLVTSVALSLSFFHRSFPFTFPTPHRSGELSYGDVSHWNDPELQSRDLTQPGGRERTIDALTSPSWLLFSIPSTSKQHGEHGADGVP